MHPREYGDPDRPEPRKRGRPFGPMGPTRPVSVRVPLPILEELDRIAELRGEGRSEVVLAALRGWLAE